MGGALLDGVTVLDLSVWRPGPYATQLLADAGADVLKVEPPGGDPMRAYPGLFERLHAGKRSVALDLKDPAAVRRCLALAAGADVVVEGFRPGVVDRLGVGYRQVAGVNPAVVYCSVSGMGQDGPLADVPGHDVNYQGWAGTLAPDGGTPVTPAVPVADLASGMAAAFAVTAALLRRGRTGEGEHVDVAMGDVLATWTGATAPGGGSGAAARVVPGYGPFEAAGGEHLTLGVVSEDHFWRPLCLVLGLDELAAASFAERLERRVELQEAVASAVAGRGRDELVAELLAAGVPAAPVLTRAQMAVLPHFRRRGAVLEGPGGAPVTGYPLTLAGHPFGPLRPAPGLDQHRGAGWLRSGDRAPEVL